MKNMAAMEEKLAAKKVQKSYADSLSEVPFINKKFEKSYFDVLGLCCSSEVPLIENILKPLDGINDVTVIVPTKTVVVVHDALLISPHDIVKALNKSRLEANIRAYGDKYYQKKWPSPHVVACGVLLLLSFLNYIYAPLMWLAVAAVAVGIFPIILSAISAIRNLTLDVNLLMLIAVGGSIALEDYIEAGTIVFLFTAAQWLESRASHKATAAMSSLINLLPRRAVLAESHEEVNADEVKLDSKIVVKAGEVIPIDGVVVEGNCEVDEKTLTGESFPVSKEKDSSVWAGTINLNGYICIRTTVLAEDCVVARMVKLVEDAQSNKSRTQRFIDECAKYYTPAVVILSACFAIIPAALRVQDQKHWYRLALVILVSACPCALILSTPVAMFCALSKAAASGVLFKGAEYLETLAKVKIMAFDKTGTITRGEFTVTDFRLILDDFSLETMLYWVSSIESKSSHPMAAAIVDYAQSHSVVPMPDKVEQFQNFPGEGIYGKIEGKEIYIGNSKISLRAGCSSVPTMQDESVEGKSIGLIFFGSSPVGFFSLSDVCRTGVNDALKELKLMGIKTAMLTGDSRGAAKHAQNQLEGDLDVVHYDLLPEDKARIIQEFQKKAPTAMIGDGINDAPALSTADIGISMAVAGSALATETGNVILMTNDIRRIPNALRLARRVQRKVIENVILSIIPKTVILALAIAGHPLVWAAVLCDVGTCLLVILNSMLLLREKEGYRRNSLKNSAASICTAKCKFNTLSSHSCVKSTCSASTDIQGCCLRSNQLSGAKDPDNGCCNKVQETRNCGKVYHRCSDQLTPNEENKCPSTVQKSNVCAEDDEIHDLEHPDHIKPSPETLIDHSSTSLAIGGRRALNNDIQEIQIGGCCSKACCSENSPERSSSREGLSEIVIE